MRLTAVRGQIRLVRHPPVEHGGRCYGRLELPVDPAAAEALAAQLRPVAGTVWTSPAQRCRAVAAALGAHRVDSRLHELDFGAWEGLAWDAVPRPALDRWSADPWTFAPPDGESGMALVARVQAFAGVLRGGDVVVSHGGPLKVLLATLRGETVQLLRPPPPPGSVTAITQSPPPAPPTCTSRSSR